MRSVACFARKKQMPAAMTTKGVVAGRHLERTKAESFAAAV
jgi:hypothetical protein